MFADFFLSVLLRKTTLPVQKIERFKNYFVAFFSEVFYAKIIHMPGSENSAVRPNYC